MLLNVVLAIASRTADFLGVELYKKHMNEQALADRFEDATWMDEQPNPDLNFVGVYALSELVREKGFRVLINGMCGEKLHPIYINNLHLFLFLHKPIPHAPLSNNTDNNPPGQGSDELFAGYPLFLPDYLREPDHSFPPSLIPDSVRKAHLLKAEADLSPPTSTTLSPPISTNHPSPSPNSLTATTTPLHMSTTYPALPFIPSLLQSPPSPHTLYTTPLPAPVLAKMRETWHPLHTASYIFRKAHLENLLLSCLGDRGEMAHGIEGRTPFLDHRLTEYADGLPPGVKIRAAGLGTEASGRTGLEGDKAQQQHRAEENNHKNKKKNNSNSNGANDDTKDMDPNSPPSKEREEGDTHPVTFATKSILRAAALPFITPEIHAAPKHPYSAPVRYGPGGPLHRLVRRLVTEENVDRLGFLAWRGGGGDGDGNGDVNRDGDGKGGRTLGEVVDGAFGGDGDGGKDGGREGKRERGAKGDDGEFRLVICLAQWVVLGRRFGIGGMGSGERGERGGGRGEGSRE